MLENSLSQKLLNAALSAGASRSAIVSTHDVVFNESLRDMCAMNTCGNYNTCWVCPPAVGPVADWRARVEGRDWGVVVQTIYQLEDSFDFEGMVKAGQQHKANYLRALEALRGFELPDMLALNASNCSICERCTYPDAPCRFPDRAIVSVEACGIDVNNTLLACGLQYNNGPATVSYVGIVFFREP